MASFVRRLILPGSRKLVMSSLPSCQPVRTIVYTETGAILEKPTKVRFGIWKVLGVAVPFIYIGGLMSKMGAAFLEENDIFVPDEDDD